MLTQDYLNVARDLIDKGNPVEASQYLNMVGNAESDYLLSTIVDILPAEIKEKLELKTCFELLLSSAIRGCSKAMKPLGDCYRRDSQFRLKDEQKAFYWYRKAYESGEEEAIPALIECYRNGIGTEQNFTEVVRLRRELENRRIKRVSPII